MRKRKRTTAVHHTMAHDIKRTVCFLLVLMLIRLHVDPDGVMHTSWESGLDGAVAFETDPSNYLIGTLTFKDEPVTRKLKIRKVDENGELILTDEASFSLTGTPAGAEVFEDASLTTTDAVTDEVSLPYGSYTLMETDAPRGYSALDATISLVVDEHGITAVGNAMEDFITVTEESGVYTMDATNYPGISLTIDHEMGGNAYSPRDKFTLVLISNEITKTKYTGTRNGAAAAFNAVPASGTTPGRIEIRNVQKGDEIIVKAMSVGVYILKETNSGTYTVSYDASLTGDSTPVPDSPVEE